jgi:hypothetical protein
LHFNALSSTGMSTFVNVLEIVHDAVNFRAPHSSGRLLFPFMTKEIPGASTNATQGSELSFDSACRTKRQIDAI